MKKITKYITLALLGITAVSCEKYVEGVNINPNNFTDSPGELIIGQAGLATIMLSESQPARYAGIFTDQFTGSDRQFVSYESYQVIAGDFDDTWTNIYTTGLAQTRLVQEKATASGNKSLLGVAQLLEGLLMGESAALFGDVPYSQAIQPEVYPNPQYDSQKDVLNKVQEVLSEGITNVTNGTATIPMLMFKGAYSWAEVGHTLKARYYLIAKDYPNAAKEAALGISAESKSLLAAHSDAIGQQNLFYQFGVLQRGGYLTVMRSYLKKLLTGASPRRLNTPGDANRASVYFLGNELNYNAGGYFAINASFPIVSWEENQFILAESLARTGSEADGRTRFNSLRSALGSKYGGSFPATNSGGSQLIREILEEKYITMIGSLQVFHDVRRTNNMIGVPIKSATSTTIPQRFLYPQAEVNTNKSFPGIVELFAATPVNK